MTTHLASSGLQLRLASRRRRPDSLLLEVPGAELVDVTARGPEPWVRFDPAYPLGGIPVPLSPGYVAASVQSIWEGLKVFENEDVDPSLFVRTDPRGLARRSRGRGAFLGHRAGVDGDRLLGPGDASQWLFVSAYRWVLEKRLVAEVARLRRLASARPVVLLHDASGAGREEPARPVPHAVILEGLLTGTWPVVPGAVERKGSWGRTAGKE